MSIEVLIARWVSLVWIVCGLSHAIYPGLWVKLLWPLRERDTGGFLLASFNFPIGLVIVLGHNVWEPGIPVIVTVAGWLTTIKSTIYLLFPRAHMRVMPTRMRPERAFRAAGLVIIVLGFVVGYDAFFRR